MKAACPVNFLRFIEGDEEQLKLYDSYYRQYYLKRFNWCQRSDIVEEAYWHGLAKAWQKRPEIESLDHLFYYVRIRMLDYISKELSRNNTKERKQDIIKELFYSFEYAPIREEEELVAAMINVVNIIDPGTAKVIQLIYKDGYNVPQVADIMRLPKTTIEGRKHRGKSWMQAWIAHEALGMADWWLRNKINSLIINSMPEISKRHHAKIRAQFAGSEEHQQKARELGVTSGMMWMRLKKMKILDERFHSRPMSLFPQWETWSDFLNLISDKTRRTSR